MRIQLKRRAGVMILVVGAIMASATFNSAAQEVTIPEKLLFLSNHFSNTNNGKLEYTYSQEIAEPDSFTDKVSLDIRERHADGTAAVATHFLSGKHEITVPALDQAQGNPAILGFLERDIVQMKTLTGGSIGYFRKSIRMALAAPDLKVKDTTVTYDGRQVAAQEITLHPYMNDPMKDRIGKYAGKAYVFILSDAVPGSLYRIYTTLTEESVPKVDASMTIARGDAKGIK